MALTQSQKSRCVQLTGLGVPVMSTAEYLASTIRNATAYAAATDPVAMSATKLQNETNTELSTLKKRNVELAKKLGRPPHQLSTESE